MKRISTKGLNVITAIILCALSLGLAAICFIPSDVKTISGGKSYAPIYYGDRNSKNVALTFNVYEGADIIEGILSALKEHNAKATFFIGGCWAEKNAETLKKILDEGHEIGSHGYFHKDHSKISEERNREEMESTHGLIKHLTGYEIKLFAPPSGAYSVTTLKVAENMGYKTIMWSKDTVDWRDKNSKIVYNRAVKNICGGDIVLMHPKKHTLDALPKILEYYHSKGLTATTVSECIGRND